MDSRDNAIQAALKQLSDQFGKDNLIVKHNGKEMEGFEGNSDRIDKRRRDSYKKNSAKMEVPSVQEYKKMLAKHDWHYQMSDNHLIYKKGSAEAELIHSYAMADPKLLKLYKQALKNK